MSLKQDRAESAKKTSAPREADADSGLALIASARTGLAGKDDAVVKRIPAEYNTKSVRQVIDYIVQNASGDESALAESVKREITGKESVVMINGKKAALEDRADKYAITKEHELPGGAKKQYMELEIEVSSVQQGGNNYRYFR